MEGNYLHRNNIHHRDQVEEQTWWPARNYACSFCKREFKSAQALGGHMNVHRRDRARLRSSLWINSESDHHHQCHKPNPTTTLLSPSPLSYELLDCSHPSSSPFCNPGLTLSSSSLPSSLAPSASEDKKPRLTLSLDYPLLSKSKQSGFGVEEIMKGTYDQEEEKEHNGYKNNEQNITLELGIGLLKHHQDETLDLELRL